MNPRLAKLLAAARTRRDDTAPQTLPPGTGRRLFLAAQPEPDTSPAWLRGMAWGCAACAAIAAGTAFLPRPEVERPIPELQALAGLAAFTDEPDTQP